jgi:hypothetical protein
MLKCTQVVELVLLNSHCYTSVTLIVYRPARRLPFLSPGVLLRLIPAAGLTLLRHTARYVTPRIDRSSLMQSPTWSKLSA